MHRWQRLLPCGKCCAKGVLDMCDVTYWLWLQAGLGYGKDSKALLITFGDAKGVYDADDSALEKFGLSVKAIEKLRSKALSDFSETIDFCHKHSLKIITPDSEYYPKNLLRLSNLPVVLYVRGDAECLKNEFAFAVIGSRTPCAYGEEGVKKLVPSLCENGALVVSGGALGIDSISHSTAIECGGKTILVLGHGHGTNYLPENAELRKKIVTHGAVVSEYPPFSPVTRGSFPERNRIISGLSKGIVIIEAGQGSGTLNTAKHAKKQGVTVYVLPGDIASGRFDGSNQLIADGATAVFSGWDILKKYPERGLKFKRLSRDGDVPFEKVSDTDVSSSKKSGKKPKTTTKAVPDDDASPEKEKNYAKMPEGISKNAEIVYNIMSDGVSFLDEITRRSKLEVRKVLVALTELEMVGAAKITGPNQYSLKRD